MSLKAFHIFFIFVSILTALGFAYWAMHNAYPIFGIGSLTAGVSLIAYLAWFIRKSKNLKHT